MSEYRNKFHKNQTKCHQNICLRYDDFPVKYIVEDVFYTGVYAYVCFGGYFLLLLFCFLEIIVNSPCHAKPVFC